MPGTSIASVYIDVNLDGDKLPDETVRIADEAGLAGGTAFEKAFERGTSRLGVNTRDAMLKASTEASVVFEREFELAISGIKSDLQELQTDIVRVFSNKAGFAEFASGFVVVDQAVEELIDGLDKLSTAGQISDDSLDTLLLTLQGLATAEEVARAASEDLAREANGMFNEAAAETDLLRAEMALLSAELHDTAVAEEIVDRATAQITGSMGQAATIAALFDEELQNARTTALTTSGAFDQAGFAVAALVAEEEKATRASLATSAAMDEVGRAARSASLDFLLARETAEEEARFLNKLRDNSLAAALGEELAAAASRKLKNDMLEAAAAAGLTTAVLDRLSRRQVTNAVEAEIFAAAISHETHEMEKATLAALALDAARSGGGGGGGGSGGAVSGQVAQIAAIVALIAAAGTQIATLGAAIGAAAGIAATAFAGLAVGVVALVIGFKGITGEIDKVAPKARGAAKAIDGIKDSFSGIHADVQGALFDGLGKSIESLGKTYVPLLDKGLVGLAGVAHDVMGQLSTTLQAPESVKTFQTLMTGFRPIFHDLLEAALNIGGALAKIFVAALPATQQFTTFLADITKKFSDFLSTTEGQNKLTAFFTDGFTILSKFGDLIGSAGKLLGSLVTPETVKQSEDLLDNLTGFMPVLGQLLGILGNVDVFGVIAKGLNIFGQAIQPLLPPLQLLSKIVGEQITAIFVAFAPVVEQLAKAFAPVITLVSQLVATVLPPLLQILVPIVAALVQFGSVIIDAVIKAVTPLIPVVGQLLTAFEPLGEVVTTLIGVLGDGLAQIISGLAPIFSQLAEAIVPLIEQIMPSLVELFGWLTPVVEAIFQAILPLIPSIVQLIAAFIPLLVTILPPLIQLVALVATTLSGVLVAAIRVLSPILTGLAQGITSIVVPAFATITKVMGDLISFVVNIFQGKWSAAFTSLRNAFSDAFSGLGAIAVGSLNGVIDVIDGIIKGINLVINGINTVSGARIPAIPTIPHVSTSSSSSGSTSGGGSKGNGSTAFAEGGIVTQPTYSLTGEDGIEAIVPLERDLNSVNASVRALSAFAQGLPYGKSQADSSTAGIKNYIAPGAIQVTTTADPVIAAEQVLDRLVASMA